jgi:hypothetical protein
MSQILNLKDQTLKKMLCKKWRNIETDAKRKFVNFSLTLSAKALLRLKSNYYAIYLTYLWIVQSSDNNFVWTLYFYRTSSASTSLLFW